MAAKKKTSVKSFESIVGHEVYRVWIGMLKILVPHGRTHRLSVVVAGMIQYAASVAAQEKPELYEQIFEMTDYDDFEVGNKNLVPYAEQLFKDAKVKSERLNSRGQGYSIIESSLQEYERWEFMPWE